MKSISGAIVASLFALSIAGADESDIVLIEATELSQYHRDLQKLLAESSGETREVYVRGAIGADSPLPESDDRNHFLNIVHRSGYSWAESHDSIADFYIIVEGAGTLLLGGEMVEPLSIDERPGEWRAPRLDGAKPYELAKGDLINIPSDVPHQWELTDEESITYVIVKVLEEPEPSHSR